MTDAHTNDGTHREHTPGQDAGAETPSAENRNGLLVSRRGALIGGALGFAAVLGVADADPDLALASTPALTDSIPLPTTTAPEQLRLAWGANPTTEVTISWSAPGSVAMPAPTLSYSTSPITIGNPGTVVTPPAASPLSLSAPRTGPSATSFTDGLSGETTYHYHVPLSGLEPDTQYYYEVSNGATTPATAGGSFFTAPTGRAAYRFTAFGDIGTPYTGNPSTYTWKESSDTSLYTVDGVISPGDGKGPGLFHLMLADLAYANVNPGNTPNIWRDYQINTSRASQGQPWMPIQGNHEVELGVCDTQGTPTSGQYYNGPYGAGNYLARHLLPDNGLTNWDGNSLQGNFYSFQVGTVLFICLNTNDVVWQNPQTVSNSSTSYAGTYTSGATIPSGTVGVGQYLATGNLVAEATNTQLVPDTTSGTPHLQTQWLERQLQAARAGGSSVDIIVVCEHHCALSSGPNNGCDLAIRAAWMPLYDQYEVDLVIGGHDHDYERSYPVRGYDAGTPGTATAAFSNPWGTYSSGEAINTRRPTVVASEPTVLSNGQNAWNTAQGTVYLQLGGAGAAGGPLPTTDTSTGLREAVIWATNTGVASKQCATEDATWSAIYDTSDNYGYAVFDVNPGSAPGETILTYQWYQVPTVANGGTTTMPTTPFEEFVFTRLMPSGQVTVEGAVQGVVEVGDTVSATPSGWPTGAGYSYQWLRSDVAIAGATGASYAVAAADVGQQLAVQVTVTAQSYPATSASSAALSVTDGALTLPIPTISGTPQVGYTVAANLATSAPTGSLSYQWLLGGTAVQDAIAATYGIVAGDAGQELQVEVTETTAGYTQSSVRSNAVRIKGATFKKPPAPTIHGVAAVGRTVSVETGTWSPAADFTFQWLLDGHPISGATHKSLKLQGSFAGKKLSIRVTGTRKGYSPGQATSAQTVVHKGALKASKPRISGKALVGETLHAHIGEWQPGTEFSYRWYVGGQLVPGATGHAFRVQSEHRGKRVVLEVSGRLAGHDPVRASSAATRVVRRPWSVL